MYKSIDNNNADLLTFMTTKWILQLISQLIESDMLVSSKKYIILNII